MLPVLPNSQLPQPLERRPDGMLWVHSWFNTIQGEGPFSGRAAFFIRLVGCNLQCPGCDTEYTAIKQLLAVVEIGHLAEDNNVPQGGLIVITGGEPFRQNINQSVEHLIRKGYEVQIESNGVLYPGDDFPWKHPRFTLVVSPKTGKIHPKTAARAHAFKYVLSADNVADDGLPIHALNHPLGNYPHVARPPEGWRGPIYIQPMDTRHPATDLENARAVAASVMRFPHRQYIMGVQMHKLTGLP